MPSRAAAAPRLGQSTSLNQQARHPTGLTIGSSSDNGETRPDALLKLCDNLDEIFLIGGGGNRTIAQFFLAESFQELWAARRLL